MTTFLLSVLILVIALVVFVWILAAAFISYGLAAINVYVDIGWINVFKYGFGWPFYVGKVKSIIKENWKLIW